MAKKVIHTNPHLKSRKDRVERVARSAATSARIEGINITVDDTRKMVEKAEKKRSARSK